MDTRVIDVRVPRWLSRSLLGAGAVLTAGLGWACESPQQTNAAGGPGAQSVTDSDSPGGGDATPEDVPAPDARAAPQDVARSLDGADGGSGRYLEHACVSVATVLPFAGCLVRVGDPIPDGPGPVGPLEVSGTVVEVGQGMPPDNCFFRCWHLGECHDEEELSLMTRWLRVEDGGVTWTAAILAPDEITWASVGDPVTVRYAYEVNWFGDDSGSLEVRSGDQLVAWVGQAPTAESLAAPTGIAFSQGEALCQEDGECGSWSSHSLGVSVGGESGTAGYRVPPLEIGGYLVRVAVLEHQTTTETRCADWYVANAAAVVWAAP